MMVKRVGFGNKKTFMLKSVNQVFHSKKLPVEAGFTLLEAIISLAIFAVIAVGVLGSYAALTRSVKAAREKTILSSLADTYMEVVKNMPYSQVGTIVGNPNGSLPDATNPIIKKIESYTYKIFYRVRYIDDPADGTTGGTPNDSEGADYKQVDMDIQNISTGQITSFVTNVVPKGLEGTLNAGALIIKVFDANGQPISGANVHIESTTTAPTIILDDVTDSSGQIPPEVGLPAKVNGYHVSVTKAGYSTDQTYPISAQNPNPIKPDATIVDGTVTQISFSIDLLSTLNIKTLNDVCQNLSGVNMNIGGVKTIGTGPPVVYKYNNNYGSVGGVIALNNLEWDTYTPTLLTGQSWVVAGTSPIQKIDVLPNTTQTFTTILGTNGTPYSLLVIVKDSATDSALEGATVHLHQGGASPADYYATTGGSVWVQSDWSGGAGFSDWSTTTPNVYQQDDANIDVATTPTGVRLKKTGAIYAASGWLESGTFDTGTGASNFTTITWQPTSQSASTTVQFQLAANNDNSTWNYVGPDGTAATYYTVSGTSISNALDNNRYARYKMFLSSADGTKTPVITSVSINYVSGCFTPGQVWFNNLTNASSDLDVSLTGYSTQTISSFTPAGNQSQQVLMGP